MTNKTTFQQIKVKANKSAKTFTIRKYDYYGNLTAKYRTVRLTTDEFQSCTYNTESDWQQFLKGGDYYNV